MYVPDLLHHPPGIDLMHPGQRTRCRGAVTTGELLQCTDFRRGRIIHVLLDEPALRPGWIAVVEGDAAARVGPVVSERCCLQGGEIRGDFPGIALTADDPQRGVLGALYRRHHMTEVLVRERPVVGIPVDDAPRANGIEHDVLVGESRRGQRCPRIRRLTADILEPLQGCGGPAHGIDAAGRCGRSPGGRPIQVAMHIGLGVGPGAASDTGCTPEPPLCCLCRSFGPRERSQR